MGELTDCPHIIPLARSELLDLLCGDASLSEAERASFRAVAELMTASFHLNYHRRLLELKSAYAPFDPDSDTTSALPLSAAKKQERLNDLFRDFAWLLDQAHFKHLSRGEIDPVLDSASDWGIRMDVDFSAFDHLAIFARGDDYQRRTRRRWRSLYQQEEVEVPIYRRLVLIMKLRQHPRLGEKVNTDHVYLKVFKDIPKLDVMMLLPGARVTLTGFDRGMIGFGLISGVATMVYQMFYDLVRFLDTLFLPDKALWGLAAGAIGYGYKTYYGYQQTKQAYHLTLTQSLYFQNLDSNAGVLTRLFDEAEEQDSRTAILAYYCLWRYHGVAGATADELDTSMDLYLDQVAGVPVICEKNEGMERLKKLRLVEGEGERYRALPPQRAIEVLDTTWAQLFRADPSGWLKRAGRPRKKGEPSMAEYTDREHYIPLRKHDLAELLVKDKQVKVQEREPLRQFFRLVSSVYHFEYLQQLEDLKDTYAPFDPDAETLQLKPLGFDERQPRMELLFDKFVKLMERANFKRLTRQEIKKFIDDVPTDWGLDTTVDLDSFEKLEVFARGDIKGERSRRAWWKLWRKETVKLPVFSRLVILLKIKQGYLRDPEINTDAVFLKVFKDVPKADLEMLLPGARPRLSSLDRSMIIYPMLTGIGLMLYSFIQNVRGVDTFFSDFLGAAAGALVSGSAIVALGGYGYKSYYSWQVKKQTYSFRLTRSLYYQTLDSNTGVLMRLLDEAEEQECREVFLAYFCLWKYAPAEGWTQEMLDDYVENYLELAVVVKGKPLEVDFEIGDALDKLEHLSIVKKRGDRYHAVSLDKALEMLDYRWDNYFKYNNPEYEAPPVV